MPTTTNKQRVLNQLFTVLKKRYEPADPEALPVLEQFLYAVCREGATREQAERAYRALRERFFDWNEVRVSSPRELEEAMAGLPGADVRAERLIGFLQEVFETKFAFDLEDLQKKGLKVAAKQLGRYQAANEYTSSWVTQRSLGGHAIPVDAPTLRCTRRLGLVESGPADRRAVTGLKRIYDLPVSFPEEPGPRPFVMELKLLGDHGGAEAGIHVEHLLGGR